MEASIREFFSQYQNFFRQGLKGEADMEQVASSYAAAFVAASPAGVSVGQNDSQLEKIMLQGFERYRQMGTKDMLLRNVRVHPIDALHCLAHVAWTAIYEREAAADVSIDFEVHYLVQQLDGAAPRIFGWVSGDEEALLRERGIL